MDKNITKEMYTFMNIIWLIFKILKNKKSFNYIVNILKRMALNKKIIWYNLCILVLSNGYNIHNRRWYKW